jgi:putative tryptophan/tyrosine transport system substrate-binding protein
MALINGRREFLTLLGGATAWPHVASAKTGMLRLCFLTFDPGTAQSPTTRFRAFFERLRELGYVHGQTLTIDYIASKGHTDQYTALAAACVQGNPDIIAVTTTPGAGALKRATKTIPIVMVALGDPVGTGLVDTLAKPGGNITGMSQMTTRLAVKRLAILKEAVPRISRVLVLAYLADPISPLQVQALTEAAPSLGVTLQIQDIRSPDDLPAAFEAGIKGDVQGLMTTAESIFRDQRAKVSELAARCKIPAIYPYAAFVLDNGGLMAYEVVDSDLHRRAAEYVDRILKGAKPADLPVEQPAKFRLIVNLITANDLKITIPPIFLARADEVIE